MTVYVDDAGIPASVQNGSVTHTSRWCHLVADDEEELHEFALRLGLRRSYFQISKLPAPDSRAAQNWHYDLTAGKRAQAVRLGAVEVTSRQLSAIIDRRYFRRFPAEATAFFDKFDGRRDQSREILADLETRLAG